MIERDEMRERIAKVEYEFHHPPTKEMGWEQLVASGDHRSLSDVYYRRADAVLDALEVDDLLAENERLREAYEALRDWIGCALSPTAQRRAKRDAAWDRYIAATLDLPEAAGSGRSEAPHG